MTQYLQYNNPLRITWRQGTAEDPYVDKTDTQTIINQRIILSEIPSEFDHVTISGYTEIYKGEPTSTQFIVNYQNGVVTFNVLEEGKSVTATYKGRGIIQYPAERIYAHNDNPDIVTNLQDMIDNFNNLDTEGVVEKFDPNTGHKHDGTPGNAPQIDHEDLLNKGTKTHTQIDNELNDHETRVATIENEYSQSNYSTPITETSSVISLPSTTVYGQVNVGLKGLTVNQLVENGDFSNGTTKWANAVSVTDGVLLTNDYRTFKSLPNDKGDDKYFLYAKVRDVSGTGLNLGIGFTGALYLKASNLIQDKWYEIYDINDDVGITSNVIQIYSNASTAIEVDGNTGVFAINMTANGIEDFTEEQMLDLVRQGYWEGTKSTFSDEGDSLLSVGKNLIDKTVFRETSTKRVWDIYNVKEFNNLVISKNNDYGMAIYARYEDNSFSTVTTGTVAREYLAQIPSNTWRIEIQIDKTLDFSNLELMAENKNELPATAYEPYKSSENYPPVLRSLPNGTKDEISEDGKHIKRVSEDFAIKSSDILRYYTGGANVDLVQIHNELWDSESTIWDFADVGLVDLHGKIQFDGTNSAWDNINKIGQYYIANGSPTEFSGNYVSFVVPKGKYADLATAQSNFINDYNITLLNYQLAEPVITEGAITPLTCFENGTLIVNSTVLPEITWSVPINRSAQMDSNTGAINQLSKDIANIWDSLLPLADKELAMVAVSTITTDMSADANDNELKNKINEILNIWV